MFVAVFHYRLLLLLLLDAVAVFPLERTSAIPLWGYGG